MINSQKVIGDQRELPPKRRARPRRCSPLLCSSIAWQLSQYRSLSAYSLLVGLELPASEFVTPALCRSRLGGVADYPSASFHSRCLGRALEQALALRRLIRAEVGVAGLVAYRDDHTRAARDFCRGFLFAAFEAAIETEPRPCLGERLAAPANRHYRDLPATTERLMIRSISSTGTP